MKMQAMIMQMLMSQLQARNPQMVQMINQARNDGTNPQEFLKQVMQNSSSSDVQNVLLQAQQMGVPEEVLKTVQNIK